MGGAGPSHFLPPSESYPKARAAITKAMELDDRLPEASTMLGVLRTGFEWDWEGAEQAFKRALELNPNNADTHFWDAWHLWRFGHIDAALAAVKKALMLDPLSLLFQSMIGLLHYSAHKYDAGIQQFKQVLELEPNFFHSNLHLGDAYLGKGMYKDAEAAYKKTQKLAGRHAYLYISFSRLYAAWNRRDEAMNYLNEVIAMSKEEYVPPTHIGWAYLALGEHEEAFSWFDKAYQERDPQLLFQEWPMWDPIKSNPRYNALVNKIGLIK
jgi:tetratricopeptide (TPR) repeat protein